MFPPTYTWKKKTVTNFTARPLQVQLFDKGELVYQSPDIESIRKYCADQLQTLWPQTLRFENPQTYYVDFSTRLWKVRHDLLEHCRPD